VFCFAFAPCIKHTLSIQINLKTEYLPAMKTIVLIENDIVELESLVAIFKKWQKEINVLTAREEEAAINIISSQQVDLVICNLSLPGKNELQDISRLTASFPFVPCIAIASKGKDTSSQAVKMGASRCLESPIETERLLDQVTELLELSSSGTVKGIPIHSFLQMLESERKTCTLPIHSKKETGILYIRDGELIGAEPPTLRNEEAALAIMNWDEAVIEIKYLNDLRENIDRYLFSIENIST
jgi:CheY-like chemotaxis protein